MLTDRPVAFLVTLGLFYFSLKLKLLFSCFLLGELLRAVFRPNLLDPDALIVDFISFLDLPITDDLREGELITW